MGNLLCAGASSKAKNEATTEVDNPSQQTASTAEPGDGAPATPETASAAGSGEASHRLKHVTLDGTISVAVGNIVALGVGSRDELFKVAEELRDKDNLPGFDPKHHNLVIPQTPFKPGTRERWPDKGAHVTIAMHGRIEHDVVDEKATEFEGKKEKVGFGKVVFLQGNEQNDEACGCVMYVALEVDEKTNERIDQIRNELGLKPLPEGTVNHLTIAGISSVEGNSAEDLKKLRAEWCPPKPEGKAFPKPIDELVRQVS